MQHDTNSKKYLMASYNIYNSGYNRYTRRKEKEPKKEGIRLRRFRLGAIDVPLLFLASSQCEQKLNVWVFFYSVHKLKMDGFGFYMKK